MTPFVAKRMRALTAPVILVLSRHFHLVAAKRRVSQARIPLDRQQFQQAACAHLLHSWLTARPDQTAIVDCVVGPFPQVQEPGAIVVEFAAGSSGATRGVKTRRVPSQAGKRKPEKATTRNSDRTFPIF